MHAPKIARDAAVDVTAARPAGARAGRIPALQRVAGNQAVQRLLRHEHAIREASRENGSAEVPAREALTAAAARAHLRDDPGADRTARLLRADAVAVGDQVLFRSGRYAPETGPGQALIAHELTHVADQSRSGHARPQRQPGGDALSAPSVQAMAEAMATPELDEQIRLVRAHLLRAPADRGAAENLAILEAVAQTRQGTAKEAPPRATVGFRAASAEEQANLAKWGIRLPTVGAKASDPRTENAYVDKRVTAVKYGIYQGGYVLYVEGQEQPLLVPEQLVRFGGGPVKSVSSVVHGDYDSALAAVRADGGAGKTTPYAYYYAPGGGRVILPTTLTPATAPATVALIKDAVLQLVRHVDQQLTVVAINVAGAGVARVVVPAAGWLGGRPGAGGRAAEPTVRPPVSRPAAAAQPSPSPTPEPPATGGGTFVLETRAVAAAGGQVGTATTPVPLAAPPTRGPAVAPTGKPTGAAAEALSPFQSSAERPPTTDVAVGRPTWQYAPEVVGQRPAVETPVQAPAPAPAAPVEAPAATRVPTPVVLPPVAVGVPVEAPAAQNGPPQLAPGTATPADAMRLAERDKLSKTNPLPEVIREQYEEVKLGRGVPRIDPKTRTQQIFEARRYGARQAAQWEGSLEWDVPGTSHRILQRKDGKLGYVLRHDYTRPFLFPSPWYPEGGQLPANIAELLRAP